MKDSEVGLSSGFKATGGYPLASPTTEPTDADDRPLASVTPLMSRDSRDSMPASTLLVSARLTPAEQAYWVARAEKLRPTLGTLARRAASGEIGDGDDIEAIAEEVLQSLGQ